MLHCMRWQAQQAAWSGCSKTPLAMGRRSVSQAAINHERMVTRDAGCGN